MSLDLVILLKKNNFKSSKLEITNKSNFKNLFKIFCKYDFMNIVIFYDNFFKEFSSYNGKYINFVNIKCFDFSNIDTTNKFIKYLKIEVKNDFIITSSNSNLDPSNFFKKKISVNSFKTNNDGSIFFNKKYLNLKKNQKKITNIISKKFLNNVMKGIHHKNKNKNVNPAVFLDRDGVINHNNGYVYQWHKFKFKPGVLKGLKYIIKKKYLVFLVTNQSGIARGLFTEKQFINLHKKIKTFLSKKNIFFDDVQYSPFHPEGKILKYKKKSLLRKPGNLMIKKIFKNFLIDKKNSFMIGDNLSDEIAAKKSNLRFYYNERNFFLQIIKIINKNSL